MRNYKIATVVLAGLLVATWSWLLMGARARARAAGEVASRTMETRGRVVADGRSDPGPIGVALGQVDVNLLKPGGSFADRVKAILALPNSRKREMALSMALTEWGARAPQEALQFIGQLGRITKRRASELEDAVLVGWAATQPREAWAWAVESFQRAPEGVGPLEFRKKRMDGVIEGMCDSGNATVAAELISSGNPDLALALVQILGAKWSDRDLSAAVSWATQLDQSVKFAAISSVATGIGRENPDLALSFIDAIASDGVRQSAVTGVIAGFIDTGDRTGALTLLNQVLARNEAEVAAEAISVFCRGAVRSEWDAARDLIAKMPPGNLREGVVRDFVRKTQEADPPQAINLISVEYARDKRVPELTKIYRTWAAADGAAAEADLNSRASLSEADRDALRAAIRSAKTKT